MKSKKKEVKSDDEAVLFSSEVSVDPALIVKEAKTNRVMNTGFYRTDNDQHR